MRRIGNLVGAAAGALWSLRGASPVPHVAPTQPAVRYHARVAPGIAPLADVYVPDAPTGSSVVLIHGGGFVIGSRRMKPMRFLATELCAAGIAVCAIDYRMIFRGGRLDEALADVEAALGFWAERAPSLGLDPGAISMIGLSAGASLALLAATRRAPAPVHRLACCFGLYELEHLQGPLTGLLPRLLVRSPDPAVWRERSPRGAPPPAIPTLLLHGSADELVPAAQAHRLAADREARGLPTRLVIYPDAPHGFFNFPRSVAAVDGVRELIAHVG